MPYHFTCDKCGAQHEVVTLLEFPLPENISDISSGRKEGTLLTISKSMYRVNNEIFILASLVIPINEYDDDLEIQNWIRINNMERKSIVEKYNEAIQDDSTESFELVAEGIMVYPIPYYGLSDYPVVKVVKEDVDDLPRVELTIPTSRLYKDVKNGINFREFQDLLTDLYHL